MPLELWAVLYIVPGLHLCRSSGEPGPPRSAFPDYRGAVTAEGIHLHNQKMQQRLGGSDDDPDRCFTCVNCMQVSALEQGVLGCE